MIIIEKMLNELIISLNCGHFFALNGQFIFSRYKKKKSRNNPFSILLLLYTRQDDLSSVKKSKEDFALLQEKKRDNFEKLFEPKCIFQGGFLF